jgi:hypothetical protein
MTVFVFAPSSPKPGTLLIASHVRIAIAVLASTSEGAAFAMFVLFRIVG